MICLSIHDMSGLGYGIHIIRTFCMEIAALKVSTIIRSEVIKKCLIKIYQFNI